MISIKKDSEKQLKKKLLITHYNPTSPISEQYRIIRTNIQFASIDKPMKNIVVTSAAPETGTTTTIANLGVVIAQQDKKVLLVDADLRSPSLHMLFRHNNKVGLTNVLTDMFSTEEAITRTPIKNLDLLTCGPLPPNPSELLSSKRMEQVIHQLGTYYDFLLFDSPPIINYSDTQILANICDGSLLVLKSGKTKKDEAAIATSNLVNCQAKLIGAVLNQMK